VAALLLLPPLAASGRPAAAELLRGRRGRWPGALARAAAAPCALPGSARMPTCTPGVQGGGGGAGGSRAPAGECAQPLLVWAAWARAAGGWQGFIALRRALAAGAAAVAPGTPLPARARGCRRPPSAARGAPARPAAHLQVLQHAQRLEAGGRGWLLRMLVVGRAGHGCSCGAHRGRARLGARRETLAALMLLYLCADHMLARSLQGPSGARGMRSTRGRAIDAGDAGGVEYARHTGALFLARFAGGPIENPGVFIAPGREARVRGTRCPSKARPRRARLEHQHPRAPVPRRSPISPRTLLPGPPPSGPLGPCS
jgi:hypothetical protein